MNCFYEDDHIIITEKPVGAVSEQTPAKDGFADLLANANGGYIGVLHRLDRMVGGVMVYAKNATAAASLSKAIQEQRVKKEYLAIVHGDPSALDGELRDLLFHDRSKNKSYAVDRKRNGVKDARLEFWTLATLENTPYGTLSLLHIRLHTGRTHQIRVQFSSRGYPLLGDGKYGARDRCDIGLYAFRLTLPHPKDRKILTFSNLPSNPPWTLFDRKYYPITF